MAAAQMEGHEEDKHTGMQGEKNEKRKRKKNEKREVGSKAQKKQENRAQGVSIAASNKSSRLCYKAETGTLPHHLPSSSCSRR